MSKDVRSDAKYWMAKRNIESLERMLMKRTVLRKRHVTAAQRLTALGELWLSYPVIHKLKARLLVRRILKERVDELRGLCDALLEQWTQAEDPDHEVNHDYWSPNSDVYSRVSQRHMTQPFPVPTNVFRGTTLDLMPEKADTLRLYEYGAIEQEKENRDSGIGGTDAPASKKKGKKWEFKKKNGLIPKWSPFFCPRSQMMPSCNESQMPSFNSTMSNMTPSLLQDETAMDVSHDLSAMSFAPKGYYMTSTPAHPPISEDASISTLEATF